MYCKFCGREIRDADKFCSHCGSCVLSEDNALSDVYPRKGKSKNLYFIILGGVLTSCVVLGLFITIASQTFGNNIFTAKEINVESQTQIQDKTENKDYAIRNEIIKEEIVANQEIDNEYTTVLNQEFVNPKQMAAGYAHTIAFDETGLVYSYGDNTYGQCDVIEWFDFVSLAAGESHSVGLRKDGTVVAVGDNSDGQCDVQDWTDIVEIDAYYNHTVGLRKDGTVVATGNNDYGQCNVQNWGNIISIGCGVYHTLGVTKDGNVVAIGNNKSGQCNVSDWTNVTDVSAGWHHSVGIKADGTLVASGSNDNHQIPNGGIQDVVDVVCGELTTVVLNANGTYSVFGVPQKVESQINNWKGIDQISAKNNHYVGLSISGTVYESGMGYSKGFQKDYRWKTGV